MFNALLAELVDALDLGSSVERRESSSLSRGTIIGMKELQENRLPRRQTSFLYIFRKCEMYSIANIIYGIPLNSNDSYSDTESSEELSELAFSDEDGFLRYYSGSADVDPLAFGIRIDEFDEACHHVDLSTLKLVPTDAELLEYNRLWNTLDIAIQEEITENYGTPRVFFLWSTS